MTLTFYKNASDPRTVTKSITSLGAIDDCTMREDLDIENPVFRVATAAIPNDFNYCYCDFTKRYYYCDAPKWIRAGLVEISCKVDVLMSFSNGIKALTATVARNENISNGYLIDGNYKALNYKNIVTKKFPSGVDGDSIILMTVG